MSLILAQRPAALRGYSCHWNSSALTLIFTALSPSVTVRKMNLVSS